MSREFLILVGVAFLLGAPVAWMLMNRWLEDFAYHTELSIGLLIGVGVLTLGIAWLTVSYQAFRSALANPVKAIRSE
jgi:putative ABC transport system permease protein